MIFAFALAALASLFVGAQVGVVTSGLDSTCSVGTTSSEHFRILNELRIEGENDRARNGGASQFAVILMRDAQGRTLYRRVVNIRHTGPWEHTEEAIFQDPTYRRLINGGEVASIHIYSHNTPCGVRTDGFISCGSRIREIARTHPEIQVTIGFMEYFYRTGDSSNRRRINRPDKREQDVRNALVRRRLPPNLRYMRIWHDGGDIQGGWVQSTENGDYDKIDPSSSSSSSFDPRRPCNRK